MSNTIRRFVAMTAAVGALVTAGCSTYKHTYPQHSAEQVWSAALAVAESPDYDEDWRVTENHVWVDDEWARMEIDRELRRVVKKPYHQAVKERRDWQFRVELISEEPATLAFTNRTPMIPGWSYDEAERFFSDVNAMLMAVPATGVEDAEPPQPEVKFEQPEMNGEDDAADEDSDGESDDILDMVIEEDE